MMEKEDFLPMTLTQIRECPESKTVRIYVDGAYDLFHYGHIESLRQAKEAFPSVYLIVGVVTDEDCFRFKGGSTVMNHEERIKSVQTCHYVDQIIPNPPFYPTMEFIEEIQADLVGHDGIPYQIDETIEDCYKPFKDVDRFLETQRTPLISTTDLVDRIISKVELYRERNAKRLMPTA